MTSRFTGRRLVAQAWRLASKIQAEILVLVTSTVDGGSDRLRFGIGRALRNRVLSRPLATLTVGSATTPAEGVAPLLTPYSGKQPLVLLVTRTLGTGGVEAVVAALAAELPGHGVRTVVLCERAGSRAEEIRNAGIEVFVAADLHSADEFLAQLPADSLAQLHNAPDHLIQACIGRKIPIVMVIHSTDVNLALDGWDREVGLTEIASEAVAVSEKVQQFHIYNMPRPPGCPFVVIPNGVRFASIGPAEACRAKAELASVLGITMRGAIVLSCLARYDLQKNIPGLVASFLSAAEDRNDVHLVVAGPIEDWLEHALADAIRRSHPAAARVHLLGTGSSRVLLAASDAFILNSFFEGWPVAATEAAMAGLPLIMPNVGGAAELVGPGGERGRLFENPAGSSDRINLAQIRIARRRVFNQVNKLQLKNAVLEVCQEIDDWRARRPAMSAGARNWLSSEVMVETHAQLLCRVAESTRGPS